MCARIENLMLCACYQCETEDDQHIAACVKQTSRQSYM